MKFLLCLDKELLLPKEPSDVYTFLKHFPLFNGEPSICTDLVYLIGSSPEDEKQAKRVTQEVIHLADEYYQEHGVLAFFHIFMTVIHVGDDLNSPPKPSHLV